jgi:NAD(P)-dependent dehydrogenase (short-subunit alcohol dehydrogenase family)
MTNGNTGPKVAVVTGGTGGAFTGSLAFAWDTSIAEFRRMTEVTYYGQVHGTLAALELMRPRDRGVIINVGSATCSLTTREAEADGFARDAASSSSLAQPPITGSTSRSSAARGGVTPQ